LFNTQQNFDKTQQNSNKTCKFKIEKMKAGILPTLRLQLFQQLMAPGAFGRL